MLHNLVGCCIMKHKKVEITQTPSPVQARLKPTTTTYEISQRFITMALDMEELTSNTCAAERETCIQIYYSKGLYPPGKAPV